MQTMRQLNVKTSVVDTANNEVAGYLTPVTDDANNDLIPAPL